MHTRVMLCVAAIAAAGTVQLFAQKVSHQPIRVTGCLQREDGSRVGLPSSAVGTGGVERFVLTEVRPVDASTSESTRRSDPAPGQTAGGSPATTTDDSARGFVQSEAKGPWYTVTGDLTTLRQDVSRRVEITGTIDTTGSVLGTSASVTAGPSGAIHATKITATDASCSG
jgi:hypothetical protein